MKVQIEGVEVEIRAAELLALACDAKDRAGGRFYKHIVGAMVINALDKIVGNRVYIAIEDEDNRKDIVNADAYVAGVGLIKLRFDAETDAMCSYERNPITPSAEVFARLVKFYKTHKYEEGVSMLLRIFGGEDE